MKPVIPLPQADVAIRVRDLVKDYEVYTKPIDLALEVLTRKKRHTLFRALDHVSFDVKRGEVLGIIGANGAGNSTLLKIITGVLDASSGSVEIGGRVTAILELGLGFNPEYSGRENIFLSGLLYGMTKHEIETKLDAIIDFSGLAEFIDRPVKTYSSGMHSRLAFSIATAVDPDILIIDEALAAGDVMFVQKCLRRIRELCSGGRTVLLVSHGTGLLAQLCQRVIWIDKGALRMEGSALSVVQAYDVAAHQGADSASWVETIEPSLAPQAETDQPTPNLASANDPLPPLGSQGNGKQIFRRGPILIEKIELLGADSEPTVRLTTLLPFTLRIHYVCEGPLPNESLGIALAINQEHDLAPVIQWYTQNIGPDETRETYAKAPFRIKPFQSGVIDLEFDYTPFRTGDYIMSIGLLPNRPGSWEFYDYRHLFYSFKVHDGGLWMGAPVFFKPTLNHQATIAETQRPVKAAKA